MITLRSGNDSVEKKIFEQIKILKYIKPNIIYSISFTTTNKYVKTIIEVEFTATDGRIMIHIIE